MTCRRVARSSPRSPLIALDSLPPRATRFLTKLAVRASLPAAWDGGETRPTRRSARQRGGAAFDPDRRGTYAQAFHRSVGRPPNGPLLGGDQSNLNRSQLIDAIQHQTGVARGDVAKVVSSLIDQVEVAVHKGERVTLTGFGTFERRQRIGRNARNPRTGETVWVDSSWVPVFRPGQVFKDVCSGKAAAPPLTPPPTPTVRLNLPPRPRSSRRRR
jgi:nucleoid DNA-binding protein